MAAGSLIHVLWVVSLVKSRAYLVICKRDITAGGLGCQFGKPPPQDDAILLLHLLLLLQLLSTYHYCVVFLISVL